MSAEYYDANLAQIQEVISRLQSPIPDLPTLLTLLAAPLASIGLLPPRFRKYHTSPIHDEAFRLSRHAPLLQRALLENVIPTWEPVLVQENAYELVEQYFCPDAMSFASPLARQLALYAYSTILSTSLKDHAVSFLAKLVKGYPIDVLHDILFSQSKDGSLERHSITWEDCVRNVVAIPAKVANYAGQRHDLPSGLEYGPYFMDVSKRVEQLIFSARPELSQEWVSSIAYLLAKLVNVGVFPASPPALPGQPSFFQATLPVDNSAGIASLFFDPEVDLNLIVLAPDSRLDILLSRVIDLWTDADHIRHSFLSEHRYVTSLFLITLKYFPAPSPAHDLALSPPFVQSISVYISHLDPSVRRCGMLVAEEVARAAGKSLDFGEWDGDDQGKAWCRQLRELIKDCDVDVERLAEELEEVSIPHESWEKGIPQASKPKLTVEEPAAGYDSDDSLTGYASPASSRSASPTPSELEEIERDPTLRVGVKKIPRPVYLAQLGELIRPTSGLQGGDEQLTATKIEVALEVAEELIRPSNGSKSEENAVNLVHGLVGLQNNYDLEGFDQQRQAALNALVACCPRKAAPSIIEEFFRNQYSTDQRFVMLNALALGARELASLPVPELPGRQPLPSEKVAFPSKRLPPAQHKKYLTAGDQLRTNDPVGLLLEGVTQEALDKSKEPTADKVPELVRERHLRIRPSSKITTVPKDQASNRAALMRQLVGPQHPKHTTFTEVAAEFFISPFINRFWVFLRDEQTREERTARQPVLHQYRGAGTGLVLSALVLGRFLETLAVLVHAARNAPEWLAVIAPEALELALTLGTRPLSRGEGQDDEDAGTDDDLGAAVPNENTQSKEAALLTAALELAVIVLDGCLDLDGGRSLGLEHTTLLLGTGEWAGKVFEALETGAKVLGGGGAQEVRLRRAAAGVILKVDELTTRWRRSMVDVV
ncbi:hypothetical protein BN946_scf184834.g37 [Trametes cinnabarina]|uniref:Telomere length regulation protein conserved domain-containing protein n=1 Tax=Pycnoporus cinnabarinus TaxID=5643 RepID=A0A060S3Y2_PYCCI|nr:hypothetical protein BN946_scf184834.g37 [Trametes cinnabarina]